MIHETAPEIQTWPRLRIWQSVRARSSRPSFRGNFAARPSWTRKGPSSSERERVIRMPSIGGSENAACLSYFHGTPSRRYDFLPLPGRFRRTTFMVRDARRSSPQLTRPPSNSTRTTTAFNLSSPSRAANWLRSMRRRSRGLRTNRRRSNSSRSSSTSRTGTFCSPSRSLTSPSTPKRRTPSCACSGCRSASGIFSGRWRWGFRHGSKGGEVSKAPVITILRTETMLVKVARCGTNASTRNYS